MTYNPDIDNRRSIRLKGYDYSQAGAYFVTLCCWQRECLFGEIVDDEMVLNDAGRIVESVWCGLPDRFTKIYLDEYMIMPNHLHGIICFDSVGATPTARPVFDVNGVNGVICNKSNGAGSVLKITSGRPVGILESGSSVGIVKPGRPVGIVKPGRPVGIAPTGPVAGSIGAVMGQFKSNVTKRINPFRNNPGTPVWQRNYYERVIRNEDELFHTREYIVNNPLQWALDKENPVMHP